MSPAKKKSTTRKAQPKQLSTNNIVRGQKALKKLKPVSSFEMEYRTKNKEKKVLSELPYMYPKRMWSDNDMWASWFFGFMTGMVLIGLVMVWICQS